MTSKELAQPRLDRRAFVVRSAVCAAGAGTVAALGGAGASRRDQETPESFPSTDPSLARSMVGASHGNTARVEELLKQDRSLAIASTDWGFGDWETAVGAASHVGRRDLIELLIAHGARPNLFTLATLDRVDAVRAVCEGVPGIERTRGPHGITLMDHARAGRSERTQEYLASLGSADTAEPGTTDPFEGQTSFHGTYSGSGVTVTIGDHPRGWLAVVREGGGAHVLRRLGETEFSPTGAPHVRVEFTRRGGAVSGLRIRGGALTVDASRV